MFKTDWLCPLGRKVRSPKVGNKDPGRRILPGPGIRVRRRRSNGRGSGERTRKTQALSTARRCYRCVLSDESDGLQHTSSCVSCYFLLYRGAFVAAPTAMSLTTPHIQLSPVVHGLAVAWIEAGGWNGARFFGFPAGASFERFDSSTSSSLSLSLWTGGGSVAVL